MFHHTTTNYSPLSAVRSEAIKRRWSLKLAQKQQPFSAAVFLFHCDWLWIWSVVIFLCDLMVWLGHSNCRAPHLYIRTNKESTWQWRRRFMWEHQVFNWIKSRSSKYNQEFCLFSKFIYILSQPKLVETSYIETVQFTWIKDGKCRAPA